jgi:hypothetical protein
MHRWRDRFKTVGMEAGIPTRILDVIQGHAARTAPAEGYGEVTVKAMVQAMERLPKVEVQGAWTAPSRKAGPPAPENTVKAAADVAWNSKPKPMYGCPRSRKVFCEWLVA